MTSTPTYQKKEATDDYKALTGQDKDEADKEKDDAKTIAAQKRKQAQDEATNVSEGEKTARFFRSNAENGRLAADKIRTI